MNDQKNIILAIVLSVSIILSVGITVGFTVGVTIEVILLVILSVILLVILLVIILVIVLFYGILKKFVPFFQKINSPLPSLLPFKKFPKYWFPSLYNILPKPFGNPALKLPS